MLLSALTAVLYNILKFFIYGNRVFCKDQARCRKTDESSVMRQHFLLWAITVEKPVFLLKKKNGQKFKKLF